MKQRARQYFSRSVKISVIRSCRAGTSATDCALSAWEGIFICPVLWRIKSAMFVDNPRKTAASSVISKKTSNAFIDQPNIKIVVVRKDVMNFGSVKDYAPWTASTKSVRRSAIRRIAKFKKNVKNLARSCFRNVSTNVWEFVEKYVRNCVSNAIL